jgi:predicted amidohydrolase
MQTVRVALAQIAPKLGDLESNLDLHLEVIRRARRDKARVVVFPELSLTGYLLRDQVPEVALTLASRGYRRLLQASRDVDVVFGFVEESPGHKFHNAAAYLSKGRTVHVHRKLYLPTYGMFDEGRDFAPGDLVRAFDAHHGRSGLLVCEDAWHPTCAWLLVQDGASVLFVLSSGPTRGARPGRGITSLPVWHDLLRTTAQFQTSFVVYVNRVGYEDGLNFGGGSTAIDPFGRSIASLPALDAGMIVAELDAEVLRRARAAYPLLRDENVELVHREIARIRQERFQIPDPHDALFMTEDAPPPEPRPQAAKRRGTR